MTSFVSWAGVDTHGTASLYFATDSRISWGGSQQWDHGRKVFAARTTPDLFAFVGDVLYPTLLLDQVLSQVDSGLFFESNDAPLMRWTRVEAAVRRPFKDYPLPLIGFTILYATRQGSGTSAEFHVWSLTHDAKGKWYSGAVPLPDHSGVLQVLGTGAPGIQRWHGYWTQSSQGGTSRAVFSAFCDALAHGDDPGSGGPPQLVGLYRSFEARIFGVVFQGAPTFLGLPVEISDTKGAGLEWRNALFERVGADGQRLADAQPQHAPRGLGLFLAGE